MGDAKSGNTMQTSTSNSTSTSGPNPFIAPQLQNLVNSATGWMDKNQTAPAYFPGGTVALNTPRQASAGTANWQWGTQNLNGLDDSFAPAIDYLRNASAGAYLDPSKNPQMSGFLEALFRPQTEQFMNEIAPGIDSKFAGSGRTAGGAHFDTTMRGVQDLSRAQADATAKLYDSERNRQQGAAQALPGVMGAKTGIANQWLDVLNRAGGEEGGLAQRLLTDKNQKYSYDTTGQLDWYNRLAQSLLGMYPGGQTQGTSSGTSYGTGSGGGGGFGSILGPVMSGVGMALPFLPGFGLSDRRDKTDIEELGVDPLTGLKAYAYRYKGDPRNTPKIVGPMAQDIEKVRPDLVREIGGHKVVAAAALAPGGGGLF